MVPISAGDQVSKNGYELDAAHRLSAVVGIASDVYDDFGRRLKEQKVGVGQGKRRRQYRPAH